MNNLKDFYQEYKGQAKEYKTNVDYIIEEVNNILKYKFVGLDIVTQAGLFLDNEEKELKEYIENLVIHYSYKRIFNKANKYFQKNKQKFQDDHIEFKQNFLEFMKKTFDLSSYPHIINFSNHLLEAILSNEHNIHTNNLNGRPSLKEIAAMRNFATKKNKEHCYLCGTKTKNSSEKGKITLNTWYREKESSFPEDIFNTFNSSLIEHNKKLEKEILKKLNYKRTLFSDLLFHLEKNYPKFYNIFSKLILNKANKNIESTDNYIFLNKKTIYNLFDNISLNSFSKEFKRAYAYFNNRIMKIEHCISVDWGGGKDEDNLLISCHKCNQKKANIAFFTEYSITKFFINEFEPEKAKKAFTGTLGDEALISLKIKQKFKCSDCEKEFSEIGSFYLRRINEDEGYHYLNTLITCKKCLERLNKLESDSFLNEYIKIKE